MSTEVLTQYPKFNAGQTLKSDDLNHIIEYLIQQNRMTRSYLIGMGIFYGLKLSWESGTIIISEGVGVSSKGELFLLKGDEGTNSFGYCNLVDSEDLDINSFLCDVSDESVLIYELTNNDSDIKLTEDFLQDKVVVLFLDRSTTPRDSCLNICDENGEDIHLAIRKLLLSKEDAVKITKDTDITNDPLQAELPYPDIKRFGYSADNQTGKYGLWLDKIIRFDDFKNNYSEICQSAINTIKEAYSTADEFISQILGIEINFDNLAGNLETTANSILSGEYQSYSIQYFYSYLKDLVLAFEELINLDVFQVFTLFPDECRFPYHIILGEPVSLDQTDAESLRTPFISPPLPNISFGGLEKARHLAERMIRLTNQQNVRLPIPENPHTSNIHITPSTNKLVDLSLRAIPYYYNIDQVKDYWNYEIYRKNRTSTIPNYFNITSLSQTIKNPLISDIQRYDFFRIEGHIGVPLTQVLDNLKTQRQRLNLPFDIICLRLTTDIGYETIDGSANFPDLELLYDKVRTELLCKISSYESSEANQLRDQLTEDLASFNYNQFIKVYEEFIASLGDEEFRDCSITILQEIVEIYSTRLKDFIDQQYFYQFAKEHPGMEPLGGVSKGGTLILAYLERFSLPFNEKSLIQAELTIDQFLSKIVVGDFCLPYSCCSKHPKITYEIYERSIPVAQYSVSGRTDIYDDKCNLIGVEYVFKNESQNANQYEWLINGDPVLNTLEKEDFIHVFNYQDDTVYNVKLIAHKDALFDDFEGSINICLGLPDLQLEFKTYNPKRQVVELIRTDETNEVIFNATPSGCDFKLVFIPDEGDEITVEDFNIRKINECSSPEYILNYSNLEDGLYRLIYYIGDCNNSDSVLLKVSTSAPAAKFSEKSREPIQKSGNQCQLEGYKISFNNESINAVRFEKLVKEISDSEFESIDSPNNFAHNFLFDNGTRYQVKLIAFNNNDAADETSLEINICPQIELILSTKIVDKNVSSQLNFQAIPSGGTFSLSYNGEVIENPDIIHLNENGCISTNYFLNCAELDEGPYMLTYSIDGCNNLVSHEFEIKSSLKAAFEEDTKTGRIKLFDDDCSIYGIGITFLNQSENASQYRWVIDSETGDFHEEIETSILEPFEFTFKYEYGSSYQITLIAIDGDDSNSTSLNISICPHNLQIIFDTVELIQGDKTPLNFRTSEPGGNFELKIIDKDGNEVIVDNYSIYHQSEGGCNEPEFVFEYIDLAAGTYKLYYGFSNCIQANLQFNIVENEGEIVPALTESNALLLNTRSADYISALENTGNEDSSLTTTKAYKLSKVFINFPSTDPGEIDTNYAELIQLLSTNIKRTDNELRLSQYTSLISLVSSKYLDTKVAADTKNISESTRNSLTEAINDLKSVSVNVEEIFNKWDSEQLKSSLDAGVIDKYKKLFT